jgi:polar amino acid transport system substrate-binding protein
MHRRTLLCLSLFPGLVFGASAQNRTNLQISTLLENDPASLVAEQILKLAYLQLGISINVQRLPGERSLYCANNGDCDGELYRKIGIEKDYPNLVIVPVALQTYEIVIFTRETEFTVYGWESLRPFVTGYVKGVKIIEKNTIGMRVEQAETLSKAFIKMNLGRSDIVVANRSSGLAALKELKIEDIKVLKPALASFPVFHYLNKKHESLVPQLTAILQKMKNEKQMENIQKEIMAKLDIK